MGLSVGVGAPPATPAKASVVIAAMNAARRIETARILLRFLPRPKVDRRAGQAATMSSSVVSTRTPFASVARMGVSAFGSTRVT